MWNFKISVDGQKVVGGFSSEKENCLSEACHYFAQYQDEEYKKVEMTIWWREIK